MGPASTLSPADVTGTGGRFTVVPEVAIGGAWLDGTALSAAVIRYRASPVAPHHGDLVARLPALGAGGLSVEVLRMTAAPGVGWGIAVGLHTATHQTVDQWVRAGSCCPLPVCTDR